ncbi:MAG: hypothetical protein ABH950_04625 [Candidatus Altiarchaeota archaeon]
MADAELKIRRISQFDLRELSLLLSGLLKAMGYDVFSQNTHKHNILLEGRKGDEFQKNEIGFYVFRDTKKVAPKSVKSVLDEKRLVGKKVIITSLYGFTAGVGSMLPAEVRKIEPEELIDLLEKYQVDSSQAIHHTMVEKAYESAMSMDEATEYFGERKTRKFLKIVGSDEQLFKVDEGFAPIGSFTVTRQDSVRVRKLISATKKSVEKTNRFSVNLNTTQLCFVESSGLKRKRRIATSDVLKKLFELDEKAMEILADIIRNDEITLAELSKRHFLFHEEEQDKIMILSSKGLIDDKPGLEPGFISNIDLPSFESSSFDIEEYLVSGSALETRVKPDSIVYEPKKIEKILSRFFSGVASFGGVKYMPYFRATFVDEHERRRTETKFSPKFKNR